MASIDKELESAILGQDAKEKNKLLLRLIRKDEILVEQLKYKLLEDPVIDLELRLEKARSSINNRFDLLKTYRNPKYFYSEIRKCYGDINFFKKITGNKLGEAELNVFCLYEFMQAFPWFFVKRVNILDVYSHKILKNLAKKMEMTLKMVRALHEDYHIEFAARLNYILEIGHAGEMDSYTLDLPENFEI